MPLPEPKKNEKRPEFMERCVPFVSKEGKTNKEAVAICMVQWRNRESNR